MNNIENNTKQHSFLKKIALKLPAVIIVFTITFLSSQSTLPGMPTFPGADKVMHFAAYAALAAFIGLWFSRESWLKKPLRNFIVCTAIASVYGALDELHQYFVPGRHCDFWDWVADTLGAAAGSLFILLASRILEKTISRRNNQTV
jgi:VanZ family protein